MEESLKLIIRMLFLIHSENLAIAKAMDENPERLEALWEEAYRKAIIGDDESKIG